MLNTLYLHEPGLSVHKLDERLVVRNRENKVVSDVPLINLKQVAVIGRGIDMTTEALLTLVDRGIDICFFTRSLKLRGRVIGEAHQDARLRFLQARYVDDPAKQMPVARQFILGKLYNQRQALLAAKQTKAAAAISQVIEKLPGVREPESLLGFEGHAAATYFDGLRAAYPVLREMGFTRREFYPPPDPANALLSYGYSLLTREAFAAAYRVGLDPYLGFFHVIDYGRPSLALDLIEEFRPVVVDPLIIGLLEKGIITRADFERAAVQLQLPEPVPAPASALALPAPAGKLAPVSRENKTAGRSVPGTGWRLKQEGRTQFLRHYEQRMMGENFYQLENRNRRLRHIIEGQARQLARIILGELERYQPFLVN